MERPVRMSVAVVMMLGLVPLLSCARHPPDGAREEVGRAESGPGETGKQAGELTPEPWKRILTEGRVFSPGDLSDLVGATDVCARGTGIDPGPTTVEAILVGEPESRISYADLVAAYGPPNSGPAESAVKHPVTYTYGPVTLYGSPGGQDVCSNRLGLSFPLWSILYFHEHGDWPDWGHYDAMPPELALPISPFASDTDGRSEGGDTTDPSTE